MFIGQSQIPLPHVECLGVENTIVIAQSQGKGAVLGYGYDGVCRHNSDLSSIFYSKNREWIMRSERVWGEKTHPKFDHTRKRSKSETNLTVV
jgi:hypothetical protein